MRYLLFLLVATTCIGPLTTANGGVVKGRVYDATTMESLPGVHVIYGREMGTVTDNEGNFIFTAGPGRVEVSFRFVGYSTSSRTIDVGNTDTVLLNIGLVPLISEINEIVVSAGKAEQRMSELTVSMNIIKPYMLSYNHIINAEEMLNKTPGIEIMDGQASIRGGSGYSYGAGSRVLALTDGLPILSADAGNIKWGTLPLENISQIEVIKGASSVLYGSSALNGVINFITAEPGPEPVTQLSVMSGIYDKPANSDWVWWDSPRMVESLSFSHSGKYANTDIGMGGRLMNDNGYRRLDDERSGRVNLSIRQRSKKFESMKYGVSLNATITHKTDFLLWEDADSGALKQNELTAMDFKGISVAVDPFITIDKKDRFKHDLKLRVLSNLNRLPENSNNNSDSHSIFSEYQFSYFGSDILRLVAGLSQQYSIINSNFYGDHNGLNFAGYMQGELRPLSRLKIVAGMRLEENFLDGTADKLVPIFRAGINWEATDNTFVRASFGQGYRYPAIAEKYAYTTVGTVKIFPNNEIRSESGWSSEVGLKQVISGKALSGQADISLFYSQNRDLIEYVFGMWIDPVTQINGIGFRPTNIENSRVYGIELELMLNRSIGQFNTTVRGGYTYMYPVEFNGVTYKNTGAFLKYRRKHSTELTLRTIYRKIELGINFYLKSRVLVIDDVFTGPYSETILPGFLNYWSENNTGHFLMDCNLGYRINDSYLVSFAVKNMTNTEYMGRPGDIMPHRYFSLQFSARF
ncbi:MAG TPA: TonB-dependent receptor [Bacteroidales bacterium]|nr:TonB-dependent receptor [Bacteroidales bacterium]